MKSADSATPRLLIADDQPDVLEALRFLAKGEGYQTEGVQSPAAVLDAVESRDFDAIVMDLNYTRDTTSGQEGLDLLARIHAMDSTLPVIVMTAWGSVELAVEAMRRGARDFIQKPWDNARVSAILKTQIELGRALRMGQRLEAENQALRAERFPQLVAQSAAMRPVLDVISRVGPSDANVLITGENGTGKGLVAQTLHSASLRSSRPLVTVNTGGLAEGIFESELFGHVKGAFTDAKVDRVGRFEMADSGTLFLDEIANISQNLQSKLLRTIETGEFERVGSSKPRKVDVRVFSATNADLGVEVAEGRFRQDLQFRLNTIEIRLPPLRDRREDIPLLAAHFLRQHAAHYRKQLMEFDESAVKALLAHTWPGNVRELDHAVERAVLMAQTETIRAADLGLRSGREGAPRMEDMSLEEVEALLIKKALARFHGNVSHAANALGLSRSALYRRLQRYGL
jgi:DNA-binding NtrC family response regulator